MKYQYQKKLNLSKVDMPALTRFRRGCVQASITSNRHKDKDSKLLKWKKKTNITTYFFNVIVFETRDFLNNFIDNE